MAFPSSAVNGQMAIVNGIVYSYNSSLGAWFRTAPTSTGNIVTDTANIVSTTTSTSTTTGALKVAGGVGITGNVYAGAVYTSSYFYANGSPLTGGVGFTGSTGAGYTGSQGTTGFTGSVGFSGSLGGTGFTGSVGFTGSAGVGFTGSAGAQGVIGYTGSAGTGGGGGGYTGSAGADARTLATGIRVDTFTGNAFTANGSILTFGLSVAPYSVNETIVAIDGIVQERSTYSISSNILTLTDPLLTTETMEVTTVAYGAVNFVNRTYTGNGTATAYTVTSGVTAEGIVVTENGIVQEPTVDYTVAGSTLTFSSAPANGVKIGIREIPSGSVGGNSVYSRTSITATAGQTSFAVVYNVGYLEVYFNGALLNAVDYTATNGSTVVLTDAAVAGDIVEFVTYNVVPVTEVPNATFNRTNMTANLAITAGYSAVSVGPINIASGVQITIADGQKWVIL